MMDPIQIALGSAAAATVYLAIWTIKAHKLGGRAPPGPPQLPLIGGILSWPREKEWETFARWKEQYGSIVCTNLLGRRVVFLNTPTAAYDLLVKRNANYSKRFQTTMLLMADNEHYIVTSQPGAVHSRMRTWVARSIGSRDLVSRYAPSIEDAACKMVRQIASGHCKEPLRDCITRAIASISMKVTYGYTVPDEGNDPLVIAGIENLRLLAEIWGVQPFLVDFFPWLRYVPAWFPGAGFHRLAKHTRDVAHKVAKEPLEWVRQEMEAGRANESFACDILSDSTLTPEQLDQLGWASASIFAGGYDTSTSTILNFFLCMTLFPEAQARAQSELEAVLGNGCLPSITHRSKLPYVNALVKEVYRWSPIFPMGVPHCATEDDAYEGYVIPKDTMVIVNVWGIMHDAEVYAGPHSFNPSRFISSETHTPERNPEDFAFGFGRRLCPGNVLADTNIFILCATVLATLNISNAKDELGQSITPKPKFTSGGMSVPLPFPCAISARDGFSIEHD